MNTLNENIANEQSSESKREVKPKAKLRGFLDQGEIPVNKDFFAKSLPYLVLFGVLSLFYIYLSHSHIKKLGQIEQLNNDIQELNSEYIAVASDLMIKSKQSEVAKKVEKQGLTEMRKPPIKITEK